MPATSFIVYLSNTTHSLKTSILITKSHFVESQYIFAKYLTVVGKKPEQQLFSQREGTMNK